MRAWLARHESDKKGEGYKPGEPGFPSAGRVAWALWGGDPAVSWSGKIVGQMEKADEDSKSKSMIKSDIEGKEIIDRVWKDFIKKQHTPTERKVQKASNKYLKAAARRYVERFNQQVKQRNYDPKTKALIVDWASFIAYAFEKGQIIKVIGSVWRDEFVKGGITELKRIFRIAQKNPLESIGTWAEYGEMLEAYTTQYIEDMADEIAKTTAKDLQQMVSDSMNEGMSTKEIALKIQANKNFNYARARLIARTETTRLYGRAGLQSIKDSNKYGIEVRKGWIGNLDSFTRESHKHLITTYGKKENAIMPDEYFYTKDGTNKTLTPGDFGVAAEDINCRCTVKPVVIKK